MKQTLKLSWLRTVLVCVVFALVFAPAVFYPKNARALIPVTCVGANGEDTCIESATIDTFHDVFEDLLMQAVSDTFADYRQWLLDDFFKAQILPALMMFTQQMEATAFDQVMMIGMFIDAKHQLETQRLLQEMQTAAHRDYQPSEDFCYFGTAVRSMAAAEQISKFNTEALSRAQLARQLGNANTAGAETRDMDKAARWNQFATTFCDPKDNNWVGATAGTGLDLACPKPNTDKTRYNKDIDYTRALEEPRTLDVNFTDGGNNVAATADEKDILALGNNIYGNDVLTRSALKDYLKNKEYQHLYLALRSVAAKRSVAQNSFDAIVGLKSAGSPNESSATGVSQYLAAILTELGVPSTEVYKVIGNDPSYYAQLELLAKKIYQSPDFYSNLYDKPANVARKSVALKAIDLMLDRAIFESQVRQEMATSVLLSARLRHHFRDVNKNLVNSGSE